LQLRMTVIWTTLIYRGQGGPEKDLPRRAR
jgi:hypothetical protein